MSTNARPLSSRATPSQASRIAEPGFGHSTLEFFEEGERQERHNQEEVLVPSEEATGKVSRNLSFDKVPREKSAIFLLVLLGGLLLAGIILGVRAWSRTGWNVDTSANSMANRPLPATPAPAIVPIVTILPTPPSPADILVAEPTPDEPTPDRTIENTPDKVKVQRRRSPRWAGDLKQEGRPATSASVVDRPLLKNTAQIEPPRIIAPPLEMPVPEVTSAVDPFEP